MPLNNTFFAGLLLLAVSSAAGAQTPELAPAGPTEPAVKPRAVAEQVAALLEADYLYAETGKVYAARMREQAARGAYDGLAGAALADSLTLDLLAVKDDKHLRVRSGAPMMRMMPGPGGGSGSPGPGPVRETGSPQAALRTRAAPAIEQAGWIAPGIAYIRFNEFPPDPAVTEAARAFLGDHANATTLIFDLRTNRGGGPAQMDVIFPMLFSKPTRLVGMATRSRKEGLAPAGPNLRNVENEPGVKEYWVTPDSASPLQQARVFVLTSPATGSAGEMFAAALKWSGRATLVGGPTAGANHFGSMESLGGGLTLFVPVGRTFNPADGKDWEGAGVAPDIAVEPEQALTVALVRAGLPAERAASLADHYRPNLPMTRPPAVAPR